MSMAGDWMDQVTRHLKIFFCMFEKLRKINLSVIGKY
jgi:hypothetical protein